MKIASLKTYVVAVPPPHVGGMYWIFAIGGYAAAFLTAFYSFRIGFRVVREL